MISTKKTFQESQEILLLSLLSSIPSLSISPSFTSFQSSTPFVPLKRKGWTYMEIIQLLHDIYKQNEELKKRGYGLYSLDTNDIYCIEGKYVCIQPKWIRRLPFVFETPFERNKYCSPEIQSIECLPCSVSSKTFEYSLAALSYELYFNIDFYRDIERDDVLESIRHTKLYWFYKRIRKRIFLFI